MEDRDYDHYYKELVREFNPKTITEFNAVELLAYDYVRLARLAQFQDIRGEAVGYGTRYNVADAEEWLDVADALAAYFGGGGPPLKQSDRQLSATSKKLIDYVSDFLDEADDGLRRQKQGQKLDADEQATLERAERIDVESLVDWQQRAVSKLISGDTPMNPEHGERWRLLLAQWRRHLEKQVESVKFKNQDEMRERRRLREYTALDLPKMGTLQRYDGQLRRAIGKQIAFLERRLGRRRER